MSEGSTLEYLHKQEEEMELPLSEGKLEDIPKPEEVDSSPNPPPSTSTAIATPNEEAWTGKTAKQQKEGWPQTGGGDRVTAF